MKGEPMTDILDGRLVIASVSGGKDSTAMCLHLKERGIPYRAVYMDTGWENAETYRYIEEELPVYIGPITTLRSVVELPPDVEVLAQVFEARMGRPSPMVRWCLKKGMFPSAKIRWCTQELKVRPMGAFIDALDEDAVNAVGVRAEESSARSKLGEWEDPPVGGMIPAPTWRPIIDWTVDDVIAIHQRHNVAPNRSYFEGSTRVGCWPCIRSNKAELEVLGRTDPERVALIRELERVVSDIAAAKIEDGDTIRSWFQTFDDPRRVMTCPDCEGGGCEACAKKGRRRVKYKKAECWPIDRVMTWARTAKGGRTIEMFAPLGFELGCMRWGFCDLPSVKT